MDIKGNDWQAFGQSAHEDVMKLNFTFKREFSFSHPRTTMLMFGPKNAPTKQCHYAYLPSKIARTSTSMEELKNCKPKKFIVLFITQFDGIPMADVFKVLQYWSFEDTDKGCYAKAVLAIHYVKSSMFKGQILSGSKEEIVTQVASWFNYAEAAVKSSAKNSEQIADSNRVPVADVPKVSNVEVKAASLNSEQNSKIIEYVLVIVAAISLAANIFFWVEITLLWKEVNSLKKSYSA